MAGTITLTFNSLPVAAERRSVRIIIDAGSPVSLAETLVAVRSKKGEVSLGTTEAETAQNFATAWNLDHRNTGGQGNLIAYANEATVTIYLENSSWQITSVSGDAITHLYVSGNYLNGEFITESSLGFDAFVSGDCTDGVSSYIASGADFYKVYVDNVLTLNNVSSPFELTLARGSVKTVRVTDMESVLIGSLVVRTPRNLLESDITLAIANYDTGASLTVSTEFVHNDILPLTYSIGNDFTESNLFSGLPEGNYTLSVKDAWGCVVTKDFVVDGITELTETVFSISEVNALRFAKVESGKKNYSNTLSTNELKGLKYPYVHKFLSSDIIRTQFRTNAQYINVFTIDKEGNTENLIPIKQSENIGLEAKSTCTHFDLGGGRSGIYFGAIDVLNPLTDEVLESTDYGFTLPSWANTAGQLVSISDIGQLAIDKIGYSDFYDAFILELAVSYTGEPVERTLYSRYNLQPYEIYEFDTYVNSDEFHVVIEAGLESAEFTYISEKIKKVEDSDKLYEVSYWDSKNKGNMVYGTGIRHKLRLEGYHAYLGEQETSGYNGDTGYYVTDNQIYRSENFVFLRLSEEMAHKLRLVVAHEHLYINNILYKLAEAPEINPNFVNNQRTFSVVLKSGGESFLESGQEIISGSAQEAVISGAIEASRGRSLLLWTKQNG